MITHVAVFTWADGVGSDDVARVRDALTSMAATMPVIRGYELGADAGLVDGNGDFAVVATFDDVDGWRTYDTDPEHVRIKTEVIKPLLASRVALQFEH